MLCKGGKGYNRKIHRLVAEAFVQNPDNKPEVHHIDGNKLNNCADNLKWCSRAEHRRFTRESAMKSAGIEPSEVPIETHTFDHEFFGRIRVAGDWDNPLFCLSDVCRALELPQVAKVVQRLDKEVLSTHPLRTIGGIQEMYFVNEDGLYDVILDSRKPEAKRFRKWITSEVLPSLRKYGFYQMPNQKKFDSRDYIPKKVKLLDKYIDIAVDDNLRDELIRQAALLLA